MATRTAARRKAKLPPAVAVELTEKEKVLALVEHFTLRQAAAKKASAEWKKQFEETPLYALKWSLKVFSAEVALWALDIVQTRLKLILEDVNEPRKHTLAILVVSLQEDVLRRARTLSRSNSPVGNLVRDEQTAAMAEVIDDIYWRTM